MKNIQDMTVQELLETIKTDFHSDGLYEYVLSFSQSGIGFRRHYKNSSKNDTRKARVFVPGMPYWKTEWRQLTLTDVQKEFRKAQIKQQIENLRVQLRNLNATEE